MGGQGGSASLGGAWPTPDTGHERINRSTSAGAADRPTIALAAKLWMTPSVSNSQGTEYTRDRGMPGLERLTLTGQAQRWPTPASRDYRTPNSKSLADRGQGTKGEQLQNFVEHHFSHPVLSTLDGRELSPTARTLPRRLNPAFGCWLMGWPIWWTNPALTSCARSAMVSYRCRLQSHLLSLCGGHGEAEK